MTGTKFALEVEILAPRVRLLAVSGELDMFAAPELKRTITDALEGEALDLVVDLTRTAFIDSSGLAALILAMKRARGRGGQLVVVDGGGSVARTFQVAGVDQIITIVASREAALVELANPPDG
ncbi:MAG TPA: STAS domain-containing protein [Solirubrobacteraceae bacterium]|nr:STAS domain-containing protein [Solirubrobacteraceae bacterium]